MEVQIKLMKNAFREMTRAQYYLANMKDHDLDKAYGIICWQADYLRSKGINQYPVPYPTTVELHRRQEKDYNFCLYDSSNDQIAVFASVIPSGIPDGWKDFEPTESYVWISSLFTSKEYKGNGLGYKMMSEIESKSKREGFRLALLDTHVEYGNFLVEYYSAIGYEEVVRRSIVYPTNTFQGALMKKRLCTMMIDHGLSEIITNVE